MRYAVNPLFSFGVRLMFDVPSAVFSIFCFDFFLVTKHERLRIIL